MASPQKLSDFLSSVEQRTFKQAVYAVRDDDAALDIVQDTMIKLAENMVTARQPSYPWFSPEFCKTALMTGLDVKRFGIPG